jgi:hypothetical protein
MKEFTRRTENFVCEICSTAITGDGYTNHCPSCLWSKHVDINPGDRASECQGMMRPVEYDLKKGILHKCVVCGFERYNKLQAKDNYHKVIELSALLN